MIVFLPPTAVRACDNLAKRYDSNRSEVIRIAVSEGMAGVRVALTRLQKVRSAEREKEGERFCRDRFPDACRARVWRHFGRSARRRCAARSRVCSTSAFNSCRSVCSR